MGRPTATAPRPPEESRTADGRRRDPRAGDRENRVGEERREARGELRAERRVRMLFGRSLAALGMAVALVGGLTPGDAGPAGFVGLVLGALGCVLGARWLGTAALGLSAAKILVGLASG